MSVVNPNLLCLDSEVHDRVGPTAGEANASQTSEAER